MAQQPAQFDGPQSGCARPQSVPTYPNPSQWPCPHEMHTLPWAPQNWSVGGSTQKPYPLQHPIGQLLGPHAASGKNPDGEPEDDPSTPDEPPLDEDPSGAAAWPDELPLLVEPPLDEDAPSGLPLEPLDEEPRDDVASKPPCSTLESPASELGVVTDAPPHEAVMQGEANIRAPRRAKSGRLPCNPFLRRTDMTVPPSSDRLR